MHLHPAPHIRRPATPEHAADGRTLLADQSYLADLLVSLSAEVRSAGNGPHAADRLVVVSRTLRARLASSEILGEVTDALDEAFVSLPEDAEWERRSSIAEEAHDLVGHLWACSLVGMREAA